MRAAEVAVLTRDVVLKGCRAMNVAPPPILGLVTDTSEEHAVPPDRALKSPVGVFAREAEQDQRHHRGDIMSPDETARYTLLWDAAAEMSHSNGGSAERNWLRLMDAWWSGQMSPTGLIYIYPACLAVGSMSFSRARRWLVRFWGRLRLKLERP